MKFRVFLVVLGCGGLISCAWLGPKKKTASKDPAPQPKLVGRIASIPADRRFVLIQSYGKWTVATGSVLVAHGPDERTANLLATGEALGQFAAADLQSGTLEVGDAVFLMPPAAKNTPPPTPPPTPKTAEKPPVAPAKPVPVP